MKYIALLRGINVGGNNKIAMSDLKKCFEELGFENVSTYINSGNVLFETTRITKAKLVSLCEQAIEKRFGFHVICSVIASKELHNALAKAPAWWGEAKMVKHNALFVIAPLTAEDIMQEIGDPKPEYEKVAAVGPVIFWSAPLKTFSRTRYKNIVSSKSYRSVTIRNENTTRKLADLTS